MAAYLADHSAYLAGARAGDGLRYAGVVGCRDYRRAFEIIKAGAYATSQDYVNKLCAVVERWNLTRFDGAAQEPDGSLWANIAGLSYTWADASSFGQMLAQNGMQTVLRRLRFWNDVSAAHKKRGDKFPSVTSSSYYIVYFAIERNSKLF